MNRLNRLQHAYQLYGALTGIIFMIILGVAGSCYYSFKMFYEVAF